MGSERSRELVVSTRLLPRAGAASRCRHLRSASRLHSFNTSWAALLAGAATQLAQPSTWLVDSEDARTLALQRATDLVAEIGTAMACISAPPILGGTGTAQRACNIAGYLSNILIRTSMQKAIDSINQNQTLLGYGRLIIFAIPESWRYIAGDHENGLYGLYQAIEGGTLSDYQDAIDDPTLWSQSTCAIYNATSGDGQVTDTNFPDRPNQRRRPHLCPCRGDHHDQQLPRGSGRSRRGAVADGRRAGSLRSQTSGSGVSTGPSVLRFARTTGTASLTILSGTGAITGAVSFVPPFGVAPIVTLQSQDPVLIAQRRHDHQLRLQSDDQTPRCRLTRIRLLPSIGGPCCRVHHERSVCTDRHEH